MGCNRHDNSIHVRIYLGIDDLGDSNLASGRKRRAPASKAWCDHLISGLVMFIGSLALVATPRSAEANFSNNTAFATVSCTSTGVAAQPAQTANRYWGNNLTSAVSNAVASGISA
jgi:hypothetical protein